MSKNKYKKLLIISFCIIFVIMSVTTGILAENTLHTHNCDIPNCATCNLIHISTNFIKCIGLITINILIFSIMLPLMHLINENIKVQRKLTLVELKIIQNK